MIVPYHIRHTACQGFALSFVHFVHFARFRLAFVPYWHDHRFQRTEGAGLHFGIGQYTLADTLVG